MNVIDIESFYPFFMNTVFDIHKNKLRKHIIDQYNEHNTQNHNRMKHNAKNANIIQYDKLFFNFLNLIQHPKLNEFYNEHIEKSIKLDLAQKMDNYKIKKKDWISEKMIYESDIDIIVFDALCQIYQINACYFCECIKVNMFYGNETDNYYILNKNKDIYHLRKEKLTELTNHAYQIDNILKPINAMSYYKVSELQEMRQAIKLSNTDSMKKKELYDAIKMRMDTLLI